MSSVARVKFCKTKIIFRYHTKGISNQVSSNSATKSKVIHIQIPLPKWEKTKKWENVFWVTKRGNKGITNRGKRDYK